MLLKCRQREEEEEEEEEVEEEEEKAAAEEEEEAILKLVANCSRKRPLWGLRDDVRNRCRKLVQK